MIHNDIKRQDGSSLENHLSRQLRDPEASRLLYQSLDNYNAFALQFYCDLLPPERTRVKRDLSLNDGSTLRLWGLNRSEERRVGKECVSRSRFRWSPSDTKKNEEKIENRDRKIN